MESRDSKGRFKKGCKHTVEHRRKISIARKKAHAEGRGNFFKKGNKIGISTRFKKGHKPSEATRKRMSIATLKAIAEGRGHIFKKGHKYGISTRFKKGHKHTEASRKLMSIAVKKAIREGRITHLFKKGNKINVGRKLTAKTKRKIGLANKGRKLTEATRKRMSIYMKKAIAEGRITITFKGREHTTESRRKQSIAHKKLWRNPEFVKMMFKAFAVKPTKPEKQLDALIRSVTGDFKYNGDFSQGIMLGGCVPDFVNINGKKQVIELFGDYYHSKEFAEHYNRKFVSVEDKIAHYAKFGWDCCVIWESELKQPEMVIEKIKGLV